MKITSIEVVPFDVAVQRISFAELLSDHKIVQTVTRIGTDAGAEGYYFGGHFHGDQDGLLPGDRALITNFLGPFLVGNDPFDRALIWQQLWAAKLPEITTEPTPSDRWHRQRTELILRSGPSAATTRAGRSAPQQPRVTMMVAPGSTAANWPGPGNDAE